MARVLCCFFAAALLSPKLSKSDHTSVELPKSIKPKPDDAETHYNRGNAYRRKRNYDRAIAEYTKVIELKPDYIDAYYNRGEAYLAKGDHARAQADFDKAKQL